MASPASPNGKPSKGEAPTGGAESVDPPEADPSAEVDTPPTEAEGDVAASEGAIAPRRRDLAALGEDRLNSADLRASNKEHRAREAEEDRALIALAQSGDQGAFRKLVDRHHRRAFAIAVGLVRDENDAREIVQEAFLRVHRGIATFEGGSSFFTWLYRIVTNLSIDLMRKPGRRATELDEGRNLGEDAEGELALVSRIDGADPIDVVRRKEIAGRIQGALDALPSYHRAVILMREVEGLSYEEMAEAMSVSKGTIMSRLFHARQKMQKALADVYAELGPSNSAQERKPDRDPSASNEKSADDES